MVATLRTDVSLSRFRADESDADQTSRRADLTLDDGAVPAFAE
jgi:hypothetical protein